MEHGIGAENVFPNYERGLLSPAPSVKATSRSQSVQSVSEACSETLMVNRHRPIKSVRFDQVAPMNGVPGEVQNGFASPVNGT